MIAQVHGWCVGGASDYALCADIVIASDDAVIGTPYARMWGAYLTGMWLYRLSFAKAKWHSLTGEPLTGKEAAAVELINESVPFERLEARVAEVAAMFVPNPFCRSCRLRSSSSTRPTRTWAWHRPRRWAHPRRADAQHPRRTAIHRHRLRPKASGPQSSAATDRGATTARPPNVGPTRHTSSSPRARREVEQRIEVATARNVSFRRVHVAVPTNSPRTRSRSHSAIARGSGRGSAVRGTRRHPRHLLPPR